ncbi:hypothetical protein ACFQ0Q_48735 [Streptomyces aureus]
MAQLGDYVAAERGDELVIALYTEGRVETDAVTVSVGTAYPWDGDVRLTVERAPGRPYAIRLRVPPGPATSRWTASPSRPRTAG